MLENTPLFTVLALLAIGFNLWRIRPARFRQIPWRHFSLAAGFFWGALAGILILGAWGSYYSHFAPGYYRYLAPLAALVIYPLWSLALRWAALRLPGSPSASFCLLGGLQGVIEHLVAINVLGILQAPVLQGSPPLAVIVFAFFEYIVYWGIVLVLADLLKRAFRISPTPLEKEGAQYDPINKRGPGVQL